MLFTHQQSRRRGVAAIRQAGRARRVASLSKAVAYVARQLAVSSPPSSFVPQQPSGREHK